MNDYLEVNWFFRIAKDVLREEAKNATTCSFDRSSPSPSRTSSSSSSSTSSIPHSKYYSDLEDRLSNIDFDHIYCGCFSQGEESRDDLSQWRGYADNAKGVAIELDLNVVQEHNTANTLDWRDVSYDKSKHEVEARDVIRGYAERIEKRDRFISTDPDSLARMAHYSLSLVAARCKNPKFSSEEEFRLIVRPSGEDRGDPTQCSGSDFDEFPSPVEFYERDGALVPFTKIKLPHEAIKSIMLGPRFGNVENEAGLKFFLSLHGLDCHRLPVVRSEASFR